MPMNKSTFTVILTFHWTSDLTVDSIMYSFLLWPVSHRKVLMTVEYFFSSVACLTQKSSNDSRIIFLCFMDENEVNNDAVFVFRLNDV